MKATILDGKKIASSIERDVEEGVSQFREKGGRSPGLAAVLVGEDPASALYVSSKGKACERVGIAGRTIKLPGTISQAELIQTVEDLNSNDETDAILIQLPLPKGINAGKVLSAVDPDKDVDGLHPVNMGRLMDGNYTIAPCTPAGIIEALVRSDVTIEGRRAVVVGRSNIVGKPMALLLMHHHATVTVCHSRTKNLPEVAREADILVAAIGKPGLLGADAVKDGAVVIDVGTNRLTEEEQVNELFSEGSRKREAFSEKGAVLSGDMKFEEVAGNRQCLITPVPGGVGPLTIVMLLWNTLALARMRAA